MEEIEYSKNWESIHNMPAEEVFRIDPETLDEEDMDALAHRLKLMGEDRKVLSVFETMLQTDKTNPAVEYTNIYEEVIIYLMSEKRYEKAITFLKDYLIYDEKERNFYRNHFIRRNMGLCYIFSGKVDQGEKIIEQLLNEAPGDFWNYHDIAIDYYFAGQKAVAIQYLSRGMERANKVSDDFWYNFFKERIEDIEAE